MRSATVVALAALAAATSVLSSPAHADNGLIGAGQAIALAYIELLPSDRVYQRASSELGAGHYRTAVRLYEPLADGSLNPALNLLTGYANLGAGTTQRASMYFERSLRFDRSSPFARHGLGLVALARGNRAGAVAQLDQLSAASLRCQQRCNRAAEIEQARTSLLRLIR